MNILLAFLFFLQTPQPSQQKVTTKQIPQKQKELQAVAQMTHPSRSIMIVSPKERANDYLKAWELLKQEKSTAKVYFDLSDGTKISNVIDMKLMPNDTLIVFRYSTPQGIKFQVVEVEDILGIMHQ